MRAVHGQSSASMTIDMGGSESLSRPTEARATVTRPIPISEQKNDGYAPRRDGGGT